MFCVCVVEYFLFIKMIQNNGLKRNAQMLRKNMTKEEEHLWYQFLCRYPLRFRRQYIIGSYIVDFYCHQAKIAVELDGSQHYEEKGLEYDKNRTQFLNSQGIAVIRFSNLDVFRRFSDVCSEIDRIVKIRTENKS